MECRAVYETGLMYHHYANTAYPLTPQSFKEYQLKDEKEINEFVKAEWKNCNELCLYIHIPFCKTRCKFCEYTVLENTDEVMEDEYVDLLLKEIDMYSEILRGKRIIGYDLGGGTPCKLSIENLKKITDAVYAKFNIAGDVIFSIETTPLIAANEPEKIKAVYDMGYRRISMGIQTVSPKLLAELGRDGSASLYEKAVENIRSAGFKLLNVDLMYGFLHQSDSDFKSTIQYAVSLAPDFITFYRNRYKGTKIEFESGGVSIYKAIYQYRIAYRMMTESGYKANVGKNTFSRIDGDYGTSDYLTSRVINGTPYVGMGLGAQSFGMNYLAYNLGAAEKKMERYRKAVNEGKLPFQDIYRLPEDECIAKMVSVSFYFAFVDLDAFHNRFGINFLEKFADEVKYTLDNGLMEIRGKRIYLTEKGADFINGVIPLFYSKNSKQEIKHIFANRHITDKSDEQVFLEAYNIADYDRPSVAVDISAFKIRSDESENYKRDSKQKLSILLIKRGEHPFMNKWALPGGFLKSNETIEQCALREITEETGITPNAIMPVGVFSEPDRDPRGRIISNAFVSIISEDSVKASCGDDAIAAEWFDFYFSYQNQKLCFDMKCGDTEIHSELHEKSVKFGVPEFEIIESGGLAFDHDKIIACALSKLRNSIDDFEIIFDFLPEKFTLSQLQKVQETILNTALLPANFRRKAAAYIEETDDYTTGAGHRPAKLFRKKQY